MVDLDPRMTFDSFVVGPGNRLASAAARRAADSPAASYNPLFLYSASGLGKSHILAAMAHHSERHNPDAKVRYQTIEGYLAELATAIEKGQQEVLRERYRGLDVLLLDDIQFLAGQPEAQEMLLRTLDALNGARSQIVLASDRPPTEIDGLDSRLLSRFSGGLMVDIAAPEYESRVAIIRKKLEERGTQLGPGVVEALARLPFRNVRELQGGLNRLVAVQDLEERVIGPDDVPRLVDVPRATARADARLVSLGSYAMDAPEEQWQKLLRETAESAEAEGFSAARLRRVIDAETEPSNVDQIVGNFTAILDELRQIKADLDMVGNPWPEAARGVLTDPERVDEARALLASARERVRDFPPIPDEVDLSSLSDKYPALAVRAATQLIGDEPPEYNPLYVYSPDGYGARELLEAAGTSFLRAKPTARAALISAAEFADEFITALSEGVAGAWRERWWTVELLLIHEAQGLADTERAQDEFFHLFEAVKRRGARILIAADRPPSQIQNVDDRLRSRFEGGLVVDVAVRGKPPRPAEEILAERRRRQESLDTSFESLEAGRDLGARVIRPEDADGTGEEILDPEFQAQLRALDGGNQGIRPVANPVRPAALTDIQIDASEFPSLLPSEADRKLLENMGLELKISDPLAFAAPEAPGGPAHPRGAESAPAVEPFDATAQDEFSDQINTIFSPAGEGSGSGAAATATAVTRESSGPSTASAPAGASSAGPAQPASVETAEAPTRAPDSPTWQPSLENVVWDWPLIEDRIVREGS